MLCKFSPLDFRFHVCRNIHLNISTPTLILVSLEGDTFVEKLYIVREDDIITSRMEAGREETASSRCSGCLRVQDLVGISSLAGCVWTNVTIATKILSELHGYR